MAGFIKTAPTFDTENTDEWLNQPRVITGDEAVDAAFGGASFDTAMGLIARSGSNLPEQIKDGVGYVTAKAAGVYGGEAAAQATQNFFDQIDLSSAINEMENSGATPLTPEEANQLYPHMDQPFNEPINPYLAKLKSDQQLERQELAYKMAAGPQDTWTKTKMFGAGIVAHLMDPVELGAGYVVGLGIGGAAVRGYLGQGLAQSAKAGGIGASVVEGSGGALIENVTQEGAQKLVENKEGIVDPRSGAEIATDVVVGSLFPAALQVGIRGERMAWGRVGRALKNTSPEVDLPIVRHTIQAAETGTMPNVEPMMKVLAKETDVDPKLVGYEFKPLQIPRYTELAGDGLSVPGKVIDVRGKKFYVSTADSAPDAPTVPLGDDVGFGTHLTDHPGVADAAGARTMADGIGTVTEVEIDKLTPLKLDEPFPDELGIDISNYLNDRKMEDFLDVLEIAPAKDILQTIRDAVDEGKLPVSSFDEVRAILQKAGYDSLVSEGRTHMGVSHTPHNNIILLDDSRLKRGATRDANPEMARKPTESEIAEARHAAENPKRLFQNDEAAKEFERIEKEELPKDIAFDPEKQMEEAMIQMEDLAKQGYVTKEDLDALKEIAQKAEDEFSFLKAFKHCLMKEL